MTSEMSGEIFVPPGPMAVFLGDFNTGKSALINALLRRETLAVSREESRPLPTFITRSPRPQPSYAAWRREGATDKSHPELLSIRRDTGNAEGYQALGAALPGIPFHRLILVDTAGTSSDCLESVRLSGMPHQEDLLMICVVDIEYWSAKHTMDFLAYHRGIFRDALLVAANKADHLNANEIRRLAERAPKRFEAYGISPAPPFIALSARLEAARGNLHHEYRNRVKREVRELCDAGFDALRLALYEFEASRCAAEAAPGFPQVFSTSLAAALMNLQGRVDS